MDLFTTMAMAAADEANSAYLLWGVVLFAVAMIVVALELIVPSAGLLGMLAAGAVVVSIVCFFLYDTLAGVVAVGGYLILTPFVLVYGLKLWAASPIGRRLVLGSTSGAEAQDGAEDGETAPPPTVRGADLSALIGLTGETITPLRPVGTVKIEGRRIDALSELGTIDRGETVVVTDVYDNQVKVRVKR